MSENTEQVEAKLAAYVDGELSPAERAEIEAYLKTNPEHRSVIEDLLRQRTLLGALPREAAPPEIGEHFQQQLERSELLTGSDEHAPILRINRVPHFLALAAMVLLTVGLGVVVWMVLFPTHPPTFTLAPTKAPTTGDDVVVTAVPSEKDRGEVSRKDEVAGKMPVEAPVESKALSESAPTAAVAPTGAAAAPVVVAKGGGGNDGELTQAQNRIFSNSLAQNNKTIGGVVPAETVVVNVATDNLASTQDQLTNYLKVNNLQWSNAPEPMLEPLMLKNSQVLEGARFNATRMRVASTSGIATGGGNQVAGKSEASTTNSTDELKSRDVSSPGSLQFKLVAGVSQQQQAAQSQEVVALGAQPNAAGGQAPGAAENNLVQNRIIVRGLTRRQAIELTSSLNSRVGQSVSMDGSAFDFRQATTEAADKASEAEMQKSKFGAIARIPDRNHEASAATTQSFLSATTNTSLADAKAATTSPTSGPAVDLTRANEIKRGESLLLTIDALSATDTPGVMRLDVNGDGTIELPTLGKVAAADQTPEQLQDSIGKKLKDARLGDRSGVMIRRLSTTAPSTEPIVEEKLDLVVVVQNEPQIAPNAPATEPAQAATIPASRPSTQP